MVLHFQFIFPCLKGETIKQIGKENRGCWLAVQANRPAFIPGDGQKQHVSVFRFRADRNTAIADADLVCSLGLELFRNGLKKVQIQRIKLLFSFKEINIPVYPYLGFFFPGNCGDIEDRRCQPAGIDGAVAVVKLMTGSPDERRAGRLP